VFGYTVRSSIDCHDIPRTGHSRLHVLEALRTRLLQIAAVVVLLVLGASYSCTKWR